MPANSVDYADEAKTAAANASETASRLSAEAQRTFAEARGRIEQVVQEGLEQLRAQSRAYADTAGALASGDYMAVLGRLARLRPQVDAFFDGVMVNVEDEALRRNRLALLQRLAARLGSVAAIEHLSS